MNTELLNQIEILNQHVADLTQKSQDLINILKQTKGLDANTIITAVVGLLGVLVGAYISYYFSKKIADQSSKARFAVQRKNLIYSKIYKELIYMREQMNLLPQDWFYFQLKTNLVKTEINRYSSSDYWIGGNHDYVAPEFNVWKDIKSDIRITQVNSEVLSVMEALEKEIINYFNCVNQFNEELQKVEQKMGLTMNKFRSEQFFFAHFNKEKIIEQDLNGYSGQTPEWIKAREELLSKVIDSVLLSPFLKCSEENFNLLVKKVDEAYSTLEKLIKDIVNKYEYGEEI